MTPTISDILASLVGHAGVFYGAYKLNQVYRRRVCDAQFRNYEQHRQATDAEFQFYHSEYRVALVRYRNSHLAEKKRAEIARSIVALDYYHETQVGKK